MPEQITETSADFDVLDQNYLARSFSAAQLRLEARRAEHKTEFARLYSQIEEAGSEEEIYWLRQEAYFEEFAWTVRSALDVRLWLETPAKQQTHPGRRIDPEAIKARCDIVSIVERYIQLKKTGRTFTGLCPFHDEKHPSLVVNPDRQSFHCFGCNRGGDVFSFIMEVEHTDFMGAAAILENAHG